MNRTLGGKLTLFAVLLHCYSGKRCDADVEFKWGCRKSWPQVIGIDEGWKLLMKKWHKKYQSGSRIALERDFKIGFVK